MKTIHVAAAIIARNGRIFATRRGYGPFKDGWEFPGGKLEKGETPEEALRREIREELGVSVRVGKLFDTVEYDYPEFHLSMQCFFCAITAGEPILLEHEDACWLTPGRLGTLDWLPADLALIRKLETLDESLINPKEDIV